VGPAQNTNARSDERKGEKHWVRPGAAISG